MEEPTFSRVWFITGTSTGFGYLLAEEALKRGERVIATARAVSKLSRLARQYPDRIHTLTLDVTNPNEISIAQQGIAAFGHVDTLVNNAGYGVNGAIEEVSEDEFEPMFQTNIYGLINLSRPSVPSVPPLSQVG
jgi:NADP-dependent 3-hydroxy acid dehydrogenase YdfG